MRKQDTNKSKRELSRSQMFWWLMGACTVQTVIILLAIKFLH